ncbi:MAG: hypothetical protein QW524_01070 [Candidatus Woesearchaeota archaeon]
MRWYDIVFDKNQRNNPIIYTNPASYLSGILDGLNFVTPWRLRAYDMWSGQQFFKTEKEAVEIVKGNFGSLGLDPKVLNNYYQELEKKYPGINDAINGYLWDYIFSKYYDRDRLRGMKYIIASQNIIINHMMDKILEYLDKFDSPFYKMLNNQDPEIKVRGYYTDAESAFLEQMIKTMNMIFTQAGYSERVRKYKNLKLDMNVFHELGFWFSAEEYYLKYLEKLKNIYRRRPDLLETPQMLLGYEGLDRAWKEAIWKPEFYDKFMKDLDEHGLIDYHREDACWLDREIRYAK